MMVSSKKVLFVSFLALMLTAPFYSFAADQDSETAATMTPKEVAQTPAATPQPPNGAQPAAAPTAQPATTTPQAPPSTATPKPTPAGQQAAPTPAAPQAATTPATIAPAAQQTTPAASPTTAPAHAAPANPHAEIELKHVDWPQSGMFGKFDQASLQRGFQVYKEVCSACHSMRLLSYRDLKGLGYTDDQVKAFAAEYTVQDAAPNDAGEMFDRPARPSDHFKSPFANDNAARAANNGALPKDLSLMVKARHGGEDYIYSLLTGFGPPPSGVTIPQGLYYNKYFAGHQIAMPPPLNDGAVTYADGTTASVDQMAKDVAQFLSWAAEPSMQVRKKMGLQVLIFLVIFSTLMYLTKKKLWKSKH